MNTCKICLEIKEAEHKLDIQAHALTERVLTLCQPIRERNNQRWIKFAKLCNLPLIGNRIQKRMIMPQGLEDEPNQYKEDWFKTLGEQIESSAKELELKKANHLEHWGDEIVSPHDSTDPGGYYTPRQSPRQDCYKHGFVSSLPEKFDFSSWGGHHKFNVGRLVMCSTTKRIVAENDCNWGTYGKGIRYELMDSKRASLDPTIPGFNEWRNDAQVFRAQKQKEELDRYCVR